jgi:hypothetical protein
MRRILLTLAAAFASASLFAASAAAATVELGQTSSPIIAPSCPKGVAPANCTIILTQVTALATIRDGVTYPTTVKKDGYIVAFTLGLSRLSSNRATALSDIKYLDKAYGGTTKAGITVLSPVLVKTKKGKKTVTKQKQFTWKVKAQSPLFHLQPYLGQVVQFPLQTNLPVAAGDVVALTVPTWAPVLSINQPMDKFAYRQSRSSGCANPPTTSAAQTTTGVETKYACDYPGTRVEYSATEITSPVPPKNYVH